jgi:hypothetical protein
MGVTHPPNCTSELSKKERGNLLIVSEDVWGKAMELCSLRQDCVHPVFLPWWFFGGFSIEYLLLG